MLQAFKLWPSSIAGGCQALKALQVASLQCVAQAFGRPCPPHTVLDSGGAAVGSSLFQNTCDDPLPFQVRTMYTSPKVKVYKRIPAPKFHMYPVPQPANNKLCRMVLRFPPEVKVTRFKGLLLLSGRAGTSKVRFLDLDPSGVCGFKMHTLSLPGNGAAPDAPPASSSFMMVVSPTRRHFKRIATMIDRDIQGVMTGFLVGLTLKGIGYRFEPIEEPLEQKRWFFEKKKYEKGNVTYPHPQPTDAVRLKVGFARTIAYPLPEGIKAFVLKPTLMYLYGLNYRRLQIAARNIRLRRKPNVYTGNGIALLNEKVRIKQRKTTK